MAFLFFLRDSVLELDLASAGEAGTEQNERAVGVNRQRFGFLLEFSSLGIQSMNTDGDLHQDALTATARSRIRGCVRDLSHATSLNQLYRVKSDCRES